MEENSTKSIDRPPHPLVPQTPVFYLQLSVFWFAQSFLWAGLITIVLQEMVKQMAGPQKDLVLGYTLAAGAIVSTLVNLISGALSDRLHTRWGRRRPFIATGVVLAAPALLALAYVQSIPGLIVVFCLLQLFVNIAASPSQALVPDLVPRSRQGAASAFMGGASLFGQMGGLLSCGLALSKGGLAYLPQLMMFLMAVLMVAMLFTLWRIPEAPNPDPHHKLLGKVEISQVLREAFVSAFRFEARRHPDFFWLIASRFVINTGFYTATEFLSYYIGDTLRIPKPLPVIMQLFLITIVAGVAGNFPAGFLADKISKKTIVYISTSITGLAAAVFLLANSLPVVYTAAVIFGVGFGAFAAVDWALATNLLPDEDAAKHMGVWHVSFTVPQVVAPFIGGTVAHLFNNNAALQGWVAQLLGPGAVHGFGYRVVMFGVLLYLCLGTLLIRPIRERAIEPG